MARGPQAAVERAGLPEGATCEDGYVVYYGGDMIVADTPLPQDPLPRPEPPPPDPDEESECTRSSQGGFTMSRTTESLRGQESWTRSRATAQAWVLGIATAVLLTFMMPSPGAANERVLKDLLSEDAETAEKTLEELWDALYGPTDIYGPDRPWTVDSVGAFFREDVDLASWIGEVLERARPEVRVAVGWMIAFLMQKATPAMIEFAAENHRSAKEMSEGWPADIVGLVPLTMEHLRKHGALLGRLSDNVEDDEARRLALAFASQMRRVQEALPGLVEDEYDRRQRSGTIGSDDALGVLLLCLAFLQEHVGTEETRQAAWTAWMKEREARGLPAKVVGVEAPWNLFGMMIAHSELGESGFPLEGRALSSGVRRVALALTAEPALADRLAEGEADAFEAAVALLVNERPLAEETGERILDLYCGSLDGGCFEKLNLLYAGPDDPSLQSMEADVSGLVIESLVGLVEEAERQCGVLAALEAEVSLAAGGQLDPRQERRSRYRIESVGYRIESVGRELQDVLALVGRLDSVPRPVLEGVFGFWSTERFPEARRILEENDWLEPDVAAASSEQRDGVRPGLSPRRSIGTTELCEGRI